MLVFAILLAAAIAYWLFMAPFSQFFGYFPYRKPVKDKVVALTFDDGPNEPYTSQILDYLDSEKIKASFFLVGRCVEQFPSIAQRIASSGHTVGNHSLSHEFKQYFLHPTFARQITTAQKIITKTTGVEPRFFRPPWLFHQPFIMRAAKKMGLTTISGEFGHELEVLKISGERMGKRAAAKVRPGSIIIFHDGKEAKGGDRSQTVAAIRVFVSELKHQGYRFITLDELFGN